MPAGRPSKFDLAFCEQLINHMESGLSFESFAANIDVDRDTLYEWVKVHPEFSDAKKIGTAKAQLFWEQHGIDGLYTETEYNDKGKPISTRAMNAAVWCFNMKNRFGWRDKQELTGDPEKPLEHNVNVDLSSLPTDKLMEIIKGLGK